MGESSRFGIVVLLSSNMLFLGRCMEKMIECSCIISCGGIFFLLIVMVLVELVLYVTWLRMKLIVRVLGGLFVNAK